MASEVSQSEQELRRELQRMATEKRSLKQQLRQLEFRERAERAQESGSSARLKRPRPSEAATAPATTAAESGAPSSRGHAEVAVIDSPPPAPEAEDERMPSPKRVKLNESEAIEASSSVNAPKIGLNRDRRIFQNLLGTLHGFKRQIEDAKTVSVLHSRQQVEAQVAARVEETSVRQAEEYRTKLLHDKQRLEEEYAAKRAQMVTTEQLLFASITQQHNQHMQHWIVTPASIGTQIAWLPVKLDAFTDAILTDSLAARCLPSISPPPRTDSPALDPHSSSEAPEDSPPDAPQ